MLNANGSLGTDNRSPLTQWTLETLGLPGVQVQVRLRGNHLHILCEGTQCPPVEVVVTKFSAALNGTDLAKLLPSNQPQVYQVFLCGRTLGQRRNDWTVRLHCNHLNGSAPPTAVLSEEAPATSELLNSQGEKTENALVKEADQKHQSRSSRRSRQTAIAIVTDGGSQPPPTTRSPLLTESLQISPITIDPSTTEFRTPPAPLPALPQTAAEPELVTHSRTAIAQELEPRPESSALKGETESAENSWLLTQAPSPTVPTSTLTVSNETLARQGYPDAIASCLSEILGPLGVSVRVSIRHREPRDTTGEQVSSPPDRLPERRLLTLLESSYSPDPSLLAEPIAQRLRELELEAFRDAIIISMVQGETKPDWMLRVDLTPPDRMLKEWARWGDVQAIAELANQALQPTVEVRTTLKESTLHLFCSQVRNSDESDAAIEPNRSAPDKQKTVQTLAPLLATIAPQGILAATFYGLEAASAGVEAPAWIDWLNLPAAHHPDLAPSAWTLASQGDRSALSFLINRLLNPELERKLQTGGIRVILLRKGSLLHIMTEAPKSPSQSKVGPAIAQLLRQLQIKDLAGVRIYGRRAGQKLPLWRYGVDFPAQSLRVEAAPATKVLSPRLSPFQFDQEPEFAPTTDIGELSLQGDLVLHPDVGPEVVRVEPLRPHPVREGWLQAWQRSLMRSGLFAPLKATSLSETSWSYQMAGKAVMSAALGCALVWQVDVFASRFLEAAAPKGNSSLALAGSQGASRAASSQPNQAQGPKISSPSAPAVDGGGVFNGSGFTKSDAGSVTLVAHCGPGGTLKGEACEPTANSYPSFRSQQLDEQLVRYQEYIRTEKKTPDILIVGSSRALRGIDPAVLEQALATAGYSGLKVYNFGVNGATIQVVDLIVRRILPPEQLPKLILLADGARAVNSGRVDVTYNAIANSEGYKQLALGTFHIHHRPDTTATFQIRTSQFAEELKSKGGENLLALATQRLQSLSAAKSATEQRFQEKLSEVSATYQQRDRLKAVLRSALPGLSGNASGPLAVIAETKGQPETTTKKADPGLLVADSSQFNSNGFLPISLRFDPSSYYQKHPKVSGDYDSDYQGFQLNGTQTDALNKLVDFTQAHNVNVVFVNMPLTQDYLDPVRTSYEQEFKDQMQQLAAQTGLIFLDISQLWPENREYFSDPSHLNRYGAIAVSKRVAQDSAIPWPKGN